MVWHTKTITFLVFYTEKPFEHVLGLFSQALCNQCSILNKKCVLVYVCSCLPVCKSNIWCLAI